MKKNLLFLILCAGIVVLVFEKYEEVEGRSITDAQYFEALSRELDSYQMFHLLRGRQFFLSEVYRENNLLVGSGYLFKNNEKLYFLIELTLDDSGRNYRGGVVSESEYVTMPYGHCNGISISANTFPFIP